MTQRYNGPATITAPDGSVFNADVDLYSYPTYGSLSRWEGVAVIDGSINDGVGLFERDRVTIGTPDGNGSACVKHCSPGTIELEGAGPPPWA